MGAIGPGTSINNKALNEIGIFNWGHLRKRSLSIKNQISNLESKIETKEIKAKIFNFFKSIFGEAKTFTQQSTNKLVDEKVK
jgi:hypothetical protein